MLQREDDLRRVELDHAFREVAHPLQVEEDVTALVVVRHEIHLVAALEGEAELRDEGMRHLRHDVSLGQGVLDLVSPGDLRLPENLHCVHDFIVGPDGSHEEDATEGPPPDDLEELKVPCGHVHAGRQPAGPSHVAQRLRVRIAPQDALEPSEMGRDFEEQVHLVRHRADLQDLRQVLLEGHLPRGDHLRRSRIEPLLRREAELGNLGEGRHELLMEARELRVAPL
mmetsp:Transcript_19692/g.74517  ORF Transcript_19692/g.74517 Transcript_19692/m.74517 type:complete len:226 (-) Transcript_19692:508-1185(-)